MGHFLSGRRLIMTDAALGDTSPAISMRLSRGGRSLNALLLTAVLFLMLVPIGSNFLLDPDSQWHVAIGSKINGQHFRHRAATPIE
jgi:hypothetical protein